MRDNIFQEWTETKARIDAALNCANQYASNDGAHHKAWVIDQMVRILTGCPKIIIRQDYCNGQPCQYKYFGESAEYKDFVRNHNQGKDGPDTYGWDVGVAPRCR